MIFWKKGVVSAKPPVPNIINPSYEQILAAGWYPFQDKEPEHDPEKQKCVQVSVIKGIVTYKIVQLTPQEIQQRTVPRSITQLQGKLQLEKIGLYATVEAIVNEAGPPTKIYWETASTWRRTSPILNELAKQLQMSEEGLDQFFIEAAKIK